MEIRRVYIPGLAFVFWKELSSLRTFSVASGGKATGEGGR